jgi:putative transposase
LRPSRETTRQIGQTYFVSSQTANRKPFFRHERWASLLLDVLQKYRTDYLLHAYVVMPDHFHLLLTPQDSLEKSIQLIKGGFSYRAKRDLDWKEEIWQPGFSDHRIRDQQNWQKHLDYIRRNPVKAGLSIDPDEYPYGSHTGQPLLDPIPQWLKPQDFTDADGRAEARPLEELSEIRE